MYKTFIHIFLLLIIGATSFNAQNLVFNGDFELYDSCITNISTPGDLQIERCTGWTAPTKLGTSDYFNVCNNVVPFKPAGVPKSSLGYQQAFNGNGYSGFVPWAIIQGTTNVSYREYLQTQLQQPLIAGNEYHFSFFVSYWGASYSVEKIGALFSSDNFNANTFSPIVATPQVINTNGIITDSLNWTKIEGDFFATGGELFLTIGYFEDSLTMTDTLNTYNEAFVLPVSYYFVDGSELIDITHDNPLDNDSIIIPNVITPNGDGINDLFQLNSPVVTTEVFNRWGQRIFISYNDAFWDGRTTSGIESPEGTYYYIIVTEKEIYKGYLQLLR